MKRMAIISAVAAVLFGVAATAVGAPGDNGKANKTDQARGAEAIMDLLEQKDRGLQRREATLETREADLRAAESELQSRLTELKAVRDNIQDMLEQLDERQEKRVTSLVKMMEAMRDKQAALILNEAEDAVALEVLLRMNVAKAGKALAKMDPARAAFFAEKMGRPPLAGGTP